MKFSHGKHRARGREAHVSADPSLDEAYLEFLRGREPYRIRESRRHEDSCSIAPMAPLTNSGRRYFARSGQNVISINDQPDGKNINADCGSLHPENLQKRVVAEGAAMGVAFDGDADRALFVSAAGKFVDGDGVLLAAARYLKSVVSSKAIAWSAPPWRTLAWSTLCSRKDCPWRACR